MMYLLAALIFYFSLVKRKVMILLLPVIPLFLSKGFLLIDNNSMPVISFYRFYIFSLMVSSVIFTLQNKTKFFHPDLILIKALFFLLATYILVFLANINGPHAGGNLVLAFFIEVFIPSLLLINLVSELEYVRLMKWVKSYMYIYLCVAIYGVVCYLIDFNPFIIFIDSTLVTDRVTVHTYADTLRGLRAQGTVYHPINFGALMVFGVAVTLLLRKLGLINRPLCIFTILFFFIAIFFTNSRTPLVFAIVLLLYYSFYLNIYKKFLSYILILLIFSIGILSSEYIYEKVASIMVIFLPDSSQNMNGSSLDMRLSQLLISIKFYLESPILGNGLGFARSLVSSGMQEDMYNNESIIFILLLNFGAVGFISYIYLFLIQYLSINKIAIDVDLKGLVKGFIVGYLVFIISTGTVETLYTYLFVFIVMYFSVIKYSMSKTNFY
jgi:hypothetical protein